MSTTSDSAAATSRQISRLETELDARETFDGYARLYAAIAVGILFLLFSPILEDVTERESGSIDVTPYGTLWEMADEPGGSNAVLGILLAVALIALSGVAAFRPRSLGLPIAIAIVAAFIVLMLIVRPGTGEPVPGRTSEGSAGLALAIGAGLLATTHAVRYGLWRDGGSAR